MRWLAVASVIPTAFLTAIIAAFPAARVAAQGNAASPTAPPSSGELAPAEVAAPAVGEPAAAPPPGAAPETAAPSPVVSAPLTEVVPAPAPPPRLVASLSHDLQFGLAVALGDGYRGIVPYESEVYCGDAKANDNRVCTNRAPVFLDLQPSFGLSERWDFLVDLRFGLTRDFNTFHQFFVMPGFRFWLDPQSQVKFFTTLQLAYDRSRQNNRPGAPHFISDNDLGVRNSNGLMVEVMRNLGVYAQFGETIGFYRWFSFTVDASIGVQARVP